MAPTNFDASLLSFPPSSNYAINNNNGGRYNRNNNNNTNDFNSEQGDRSNGSTSSLSSSYELERLKSRLEYFFMDPLQKWKKRNTKPYKLLVQIVKLIILTTQLVVFGSDMAKNINYKDDMEIAFKQLFLKDWDPSADAIPYPGPYVPYAVYTKPSFFQTINYAIKVYSNISELSVGNYGYQTNHSLTLSPIDICLINYSQAEFDATLFKYNYTLDTEETCYRIQNYADAGSQLWELFDFRNNLDKPINFSTLISTKLKLPLRTILMEESSNGDNHVACFNVDIEINLDNSNRDGQIIINLKSEPRKFTCHKGSSVYSITSRLSPKTSTLLYDSEKIKSTLTTIVLLNTSVIIFCLISFSLCFRSIYRAYKLARHTERVLKANDCHLNWSDKLEFLDSWLVLIIINDLMVLTATVIIVSDDEQLLDTKNYTVCSLLLGMGNFLSWAGILRYLSFFKNYNILLVTLRKSFPHVLRFMTCTLIIYCGFCFCGWIVFGPYHFKFRQLSTTTECLFSLINGDDMFETFALLRSEITSIWWFSRIYLYLFVSLFIYVVVSLFIALIIDTFELIKIYRDKGFPKSRLQTFYMDGDLSKLAQDDTSSSDNDVDMVASASTFRGL